MAKKEVLSAKSLAKTFAIIAGVDCFLHALFPALGVNVLWWNSKSLEVLSAFFPGMNASFGGVIIGLVWGIVWGALAGGIFGWMYNKFK